MQPVERMLAEWDCAQLCTRFYHHLDRREYDRVAALMAETGVWMRQGAPLTGPAEVTAALRQRSASLTSRHLLSNVAVDILDARSARVAYELSIYLRDGDGPARHSAVMTGEDRLDHDGEAWRIRLKRADKLFGFDE